MADEADRAQQDLEAYEVLGALTRKEGTRFPGRGICYNCDEVLGEGQAYCDEACRHDHLGRVRERDQRLR